MVTPSQTPDRPSSVADRVREQARSARTAIERARDAGVEQTRRALRSVAEDSNRSPQFSTPEDEKEMFRQAERATEAAAPVNASLEPVSGPEQLDAFVQGKDPNRRDEPGPGMMEFVAGRGPEGPGAGGMESFVIGEGPSRGRVGGMADFVMGRGPTDGGGMQDFVTGRSRRDRDDEGGMAEFVMGGGDDDGAAIDELVPGWGGDD